MTFPEEMTMYCTICGGPIFEPGANNPSPWLGQALLLGLEDNQDINTALLEKPAVNKGGPYFELAENNQIVTACDTATRSPFVRSKPPLYIPTHADCLDIAKRVIESNQKRGAELESLRHIWQVLKARFIASSTNCRVPLTKFYEPNGYYGICKFQGMEWEPGEDADLNYEAQHFEANPVQISGLTELVLSNLQAINPPMPAFPSHKLAFCLQQMPPEIIGRIMQQLNPLADPPLQCTLLVWPAHWRQALVEGSVLPWLSNLDAEAVREKEESSSTVWNWELLVRQLAQSTIHEPGKVLENLPMGLRNRRRIWRLVEDILA